MQNKDNSLTRRDFLKKSVLALGMMAVVSSPIVPILKARQTSANTGTKLTVQNTSGASVLDKQKLRAWAMVIDLKKCDGCVSINQPPLCTQACIDGHFVPKGMEWIQVYQVDLPGGGNYFMPTPCNHCENAPCVNVCPVAATYHTEEGTVLIDQRRCIGCRFCMAACPYQRRFFNWGSPDQPPQVALAKYSPERQIPAIKGTVMKCDFCPDNLRQGKLPDCASGCPMKAIYMGDLNSDVATNGSELVVLSRFLDDNNAFHYKESLGTRPRVWYLPGHGQGFGRETYDSAPLKPVTWSFSQKDYSSYPGVWPWSEPTKWPWEVQTK